jgi:hypothetical protein
MIILYILKDYALPIKTIQPAIQQVAPNQKHNGKLLSVVDITQIASLRIEDIVDGSIRPNPL